jgi:hypothetical protein
LQWLLTRYAERGIAFDEVWAWEVEPQVPKEYWAGVPEVRLWQNFGNTVAMPGAGSGSEVVAILWQWWPKVSEVTLSQYCGSIGPGF